jgi:hypothetical protein
VCLSFVWTDIYHKLSISDNFSFGHRTTRDNEDCVGTFNPASKIVSSWMMWRYSRLAPVYSFITALAMAMGMGLGACVKGIVWLFVSAMGRKMCGAINYA